MMSGEPSGLRAIDWNTAPDMPSAAPTTIAVRTRGRRRLWTMNSASGPPSPNTEAMTWRTDSGKSPTMIDQQPMTSRATTMSEQTTAVRTSILNEAREVRTTRDRADTSTLRSCRSTHARVR